MAHTPVSNVDPGQFGKASWGDLVRAADLDLTARTSALEVAAGGGSVTGPVSATDNAIPRFDGTGGSTLQNSGITIPDGASGSVNGTNTGDVSLAGLPSYLTIVGQVITRALIDLASHVTGRLPWGNATLVTAGRLLGRASASGGGDVEELQLGVGLAWNGTSIDCTVVAPSTLPGSRVISGGEIVWVSAYTFNVSAATYVITGTQYTSAEQSVSLTAAHASLDRIDVIAVDDTGTVVAIPGTAASQPSEPDIDPSTQLKLGIVFVAAASSTPTVTTATVYAENTGGPGEWNWTTSGTGFNVNSSTNPHGGTKDIEGTTVAAGAYALAAKPSGTLDITTYSLLIFYIRSKVTWNSNRSLQIQFRNAGVLVGSPITFKHNTYGFDSSNLTTYQQIAIPITAFAIPAGTLINQLRFMDAGGSIGFYLDDVSLQSGGSENVTGGITQDQADARYAQRANNLSDLSSAASATANLVVMVGDSGSGGTKGLVPAPGTGDAAAGKFLKADGTFAVPSGSAVVRSVGITIDGGGVVITTGVKGFVYVPYSGTITKATLLSTDAAATAGSIVIDVWKDVYANYPPDNSDSITASAPPTLSSANKSQDSTLTGWGAGKTVTAGDVIGFNVDSATTVTRVTLTLEIS